MNDKPQILAVRNHDGRWEVLLPSPEQWHACHTEEDARLIARSVVLRWEVMEGETLPVDCADELMSIAEALKANSISDLARWFDRQAHR